MRKDAEDAKKSAYTAQLAVQQAQAQIEAVQDQIKDAQAQQQAAVDEAVQTAEDAAIEAEAQVREADYRMRAMEQEMAQMKALLTAVLQSRHIDSVDTTAIGQELAQGSSVSSDDWEHVDGPADPKGKKELVLRIAAGPGVGGLPANEGLSEGVVA